MAPKAAALPRELAQAADKLYTTREARYALQKQVEALAKQEAELREYLIANLPKSKASGITGRLAHAEIKLKVIPQVNDWPSLYKYILKTKDFSFLQRRLSDKAVEERWEKKKTVPGVGSFTDKVVSITKK